MGMAGIILTLCGLEAGGRGRARARWLQLTDTRNVPGHPDTAR
jgi:hypothetical protein